MQRVLTGLCVATFGLLLALAMVELLLRLFPEQLPPEVATGAGITTQSTIGVERFRRAWLGSLIADPELGIRTANNLDIQIDGHPDFSFHIETDEQGFRNRHSRGPVDIVAIGDSFTFGYGVDDDKAWPSLLERETGMLVANLGQTGYGPQAELQVLEQVGLPLQPKLVIWQFFANDFHDAAKFQEWQRAGKPNLFQWGAERSASMQAERDSRSALAGVRGFLHNNVVSYELVKYVLGLGAYGERRTQQMAAQVGPSLLYLNRAQLDDWSNPNWPAVAEGAALTKTTLLRAAQEVEATGASFVILMIPSKEEMFAPWLGPEALHDPWTRPRNSQDMLAFCEQNGLTCLDMFDTVREAVEHGAIPYFQHDGHMDETGNALIANYLSDLLFD